MATLLDLLKKNKEELYGGVAGNTFIESRGLVNIPRVAALTTSSPNAVADLIGNQVSGVLKGSAKRPSDTIFKNPTGLSKPITLSNVPENAVEADTAYFIKKSPAPNSILAKLKQGASSPAGTAASIAVNAIKNPKKTRKALRDLSDSLKKSAGIEKPFVNAFGTKNSAPTQLTSNGWDEGSILSEDRKFSKFAPEYTYNSTSNTFTRTSTVARDPGKTFDDILSNILINKLDKGNTGMFAIETDNSVQAPYVLISAYPNKNNKILLPATISGLTEDMSPEINAFKYIGSPFNSYKYGGVERTIKFNLKLYYTNAATKSVMIKNLNNLRKLVYPSEKIAHVTHNTNTDSEYISALTFSPNLIYLTIYGLYKELLGIVDNLSFDVEDNVAWPVTDANFDGQGTSTPHPSVINVSIGMKVLETPQVWNHNNDWEYEFAGDDSTYFTTNDNRDRIERKSERSTPDTISLQSFVTKPYGYSAGARVEELSHIKPSEYKGPSSVVYDRI